MNPEIKEKWLKALRSGEYKQGRGSLQKSGNRFCCLGVLCDLYQKEHPTSFWDKDHPTSFWDGYKFVISEGRIRTALPPQKVLDWAGMVDVFYIDNNSLQNLASKNDEGASFKQIADIIEKHF